jgi:hypothetical protein
VTDKTGGERKKLKKKKGADFFLIIIIQYKTHRFKAIFIFIFKKILKKNLNFFIFSFTSN